MEPLHTSPTASREPIPSPQEKSGDTIQSTLDNLPGFKGLSVDLQNQIRATLAKLEQTYSNNQEALKNQRDKFIHEIGTNIDASDLDTSSIMIEEILKKMEKDETVAKKDETVAKNTNAVMQTGETVAKKDEVGAKITNAVMQTGETVAKKDETITQKIQTTETQERNAAEYTQKIEQSTLALSQKLTSLSWGKSPESLIPNYATKLEQKKQDLVKLGHDPKLAAWALLVESESAIVQSIKNSPEGKKLTEKDFADLQADFAGLRGMLPPGSQAKNTPSSIALANPTVTLEAYTKIKAGFEPPSTLVYTNPKTGEIISPSALITGERTIMTTSGERFREKDGLRIPSPVPNVSEADTILQSLTLSRQELEQRKRTTGVMSRVTQWEIAEKFPITQFPKLKLPDLKTEDPEVLQKNLSQFFGSPGYQELRQNPEHQLARENLEQRLKQLYQSVTLQAQLTKNIKWLETKKPEEIIRTRIAAQDQVIDSNLSRLTRLGMGSLGQEKYEKVVSTLNKKLKAESSPVINDESSITESQSQILKQALIKLTGMNETEMYPDGTISPDAIQKLKKTNIATIEAQLLAQEEVVR